MDITVMSYRLLIVGFLTVALLVGCTRRGVTSTSGDQSLLQREGTATPSERVESPTETETSRIVETPIQSSVSPSRVREESNQPSLSSSPAASSSTAPFQPVSAASPTGGIGDVYFDFDRSSLRDDAMATLAANARWLKSQGHIKVLIEGHCDERGTLAYNLVLGEHRAQSVKHYLRELGIPPAQLDVISYGKERPFCTDHREACWQQNRRGHFVVER